MKIQKFFYKMSWIFFKKTKSIEVIISRENTRESAQSLKLELSIKLDQWESLSVWQVTPTRFSCLRWEDSNVIEGWEVWFTICQKKIVDTLIDCQKKFHPLQSGKVERGCVTDLSLMTYSNLVRKIVRNLQKSIAMIGVLQEMELSELFFSDDSCQSK